MVTIRQKIINSAASLFLTSGLKSVTMDEVASSIGISKRTLYETFKDKHDLISATIDFFLEQKDIQIQKISKKSDNIIDELFTTLATMGEDFLQQGRIPYEIKKHYPDLFQKHYIKHYEKGYKNLCERMKRGIDQGLILRDTNVDFASYIIMESMNNLMVSKESILIHANISVYDAFRYVLVHFFRGVSTQKGIDLIDAKLLQTNKN